MTLNTASAMSESLFALTLALLVVSPLTIAGIVYQTSSWPFSKPSDNAESQK